MSFGHGEFNAKAKNATCDHGNGVNGENMERKECRKISCLLSWTNLHVWTARRDKVDLPDGCFSGTR